MEVMDTQQTSTGVAKRLLSVADAAEATGLSRSSIYKLIDNGELDSLKIGSRRLVITDSIDRFIDRLRNAN